MSEFFDAYIARCPICGTKYASCEGPDCDCGNDEAYEEPEETDELMKTLISITRIGGLRI